MAYNMESRMYTRKKKNVKYCDDGYNIGMLKHSINRHIYIKKTYTPSSDFLRLQYVNKSDTCQISMLTFSWTHWITQMVFRRRGI